MLYTSNTKVDYLNDFHIMFIQVSNGKVRIRHLFRVMNIFLQKLNYLIESGNMHLIAGIIEIRVLIENGPIY
jgi:hypothetical protein